MTTKENELKALQKIKEIVSELGEDSYLSFAFDGCFELAQENIENDFACSMRQRAESYQRQSEDALKEVANISAAYAELKKTHALDQEVAEFKEQQAIESINNLQAKLDQANEEYTKVWKTLQQAENENREKDYIIMQLKAKLYDTMVK